MWIGNLMLLIINLPLVGVWVRLLKVPYRLMFPAILMFCCIGIYSINNNPADVLFTAFFGFVGYILIKFGFEPAPLLLGFVLGKLMEEKLRQALVLSRGSFMTFVERPVSAALARWRSASCWCALLPSIRKGRERRFRNERSCRERSTGGHSNLQGGHHETHDRRPRGDAGAGCRVTPTPRPTRPDPITMIVPFAAGGPTDVIARIVGDNMSKTLGQQIVVENVAGAGGTTGITRGAQAQPDGYTIMMGHMGTHGAAPALYPNLKYDPTKDFEPIGLAAGTPIVIVAKKDFPARDLQGLHRLRQEDQRQGQRGPCRRRLGVAFDLHLVQLAARRQADASSPIAAPGRRSTTHRRAGRLHVRPDRQPGRADQGGNIKAYAIATPERSPALPDVPTTKEAGLPDYQVSAWNAVFAPKGTPPDIVAKLNDALREGARRRTNAQAPARSRRRHT